MLGTILGLLSLLLGLVGIWFGLVSLCFCKVHAALVFAEAIESRSEEEEAKTSLDAVSPTGSYEKTKLLAALSMTRDTGFIIDTPYFPMTIPFTKMIMFASTKPNGCGFAGGINCQDDYELRPMNRHIMKPIKK